MTSLAFALGCLATAMSGSSASKPPQLSAREAYEKSAEVAVAKPPEFRTAGIAGYSTNRLAFALNNGLALTRGGRLWASCSLTPAAARIPTTAKRLTARSTSRTTTAGEKRAKSGCTASPRRTSSPGGSSRNAASWGCSSPVRWRRTSTAVKKLAANVPSQTTGRF